MVRSTLMIIIILAFIAGLIWLQFRLSRSANPVPGLIMPAITLVFSLIIVASYMVYDGEQLSTIIMQIIMIFLMGNIPTYILLGIYFASRSEIKRTTALNKMSIKDL